MAQEIPLSNPNITSMIWRPRENNWKLGSMLRLRITNITLTLCKDKFSTMPPGPKASKFLWTVYNNKFSNR